jgi:hypothetical protein
MEDPQHVLIDESRIHEISEYIHPAAVSDHPLSDVVEYELMANSVNYCYWYGRHDVRPTGGGATTMHNALAEAWAHYPEAWQRDARFAYFKSKLVLGRYPLLEQRLKHLEEVRLQPSFGQSLLQEIESVSFDVDSWMTELSMSMPGFASDIFLKRACLMFVNIYRSTGVAKDQIERLPIPADYQVPKMLRKLGVLEYSPELTTHIENHELIPAGSLMECEIRAASILACEKLARAADCMMCDVDTFLWIRRKQSDMPFHLTITTDY